MTQENQINFTEAASECSSPRAVNGMHNFGPWVHFAANGYKMRGCVNGGCTEVEQEPI